MKPDTYTTIQKLSGCTFVPGSAEKRFVRQMAAKKPEDELTENQLMYLGQIRYRFRKQMGNINYGKNSGD